MVQNPHGPLPGVRCNPMSRWPEVHSLRRKQKRRQGGNPCRHLAVCQLRCPLCEAAAFLPRSAPSANRCPVAAARKSQCSAPLLLLARSGCRSWSRRCLRSTIRWGRRRLRPVELPVWPAEPVAWAAHARSAPILPPLTTAMLTHSVVLHPILVHDLKLFPLVRL